jgi:hypothetical protein
MADNKLNNTISKTKTSNEVDQKVYKYYQRQSCLINMDHSEVAIFKRTKNILKRHAGKKNEYDCLGAILLMDHDWDSKSGIAFRNFIDLKMIAKRMDEIHAEQRKKT